MLLRLSAATVAKGETENMTGPHKLLDAAMTNKDNMIEFGEMVNESHMSRDLYDELAEHISQPTSVADCPGAGRGEDRTCRARMRS